MKEFFLNRDYKINDAGNEDKILSILSSINIANNNQIDLNLTRCIIDYPATSMLIDNILGQLLKLEKKGKELIIKVSYLLPEQTLINDLLGDSKFFEIETRKEIPLEELQKKINDKLVPSQIKMKVMVLDRVDEVKVNYVYGEQ